jgi:hypothetical protein
MKFCAPFAAGAIFKEKRRVRVLEPWWLLTKWSANACLQGIMHQPRIKSRQTATIQPPMDNADTSKNSFVSPHMVLEQGARKQEESEGVNDGGRQCIGTPEGLINTFHVPHTYS